MQNVLVKTWGCYAAMYDEQSPANVAGFMDDLLAAAKRAARANNLTEGESLWVFNGYLMDCAQRGEILAWTLLFDGVFRCAFQMSSTILSERESALPPLKSIGSDNLSANLFCPSGRLLVSCLSQLGKSASPAIFVEPGWYRIHLTCDDAMENKHMFLEDEADYPSDEGPDWFFELRRIVP